MNEWPKTFWRKIKKKNHGTEPEIICYQAKNPPKIIFSTILKTMNIMKFIPRQYYKIYTKKKKKRKKNPSYIISFKYQGMVFGSTHLIIVVLAQKEIEQILKKSYLYL